MRAAIFCTAVLLAAQAEAIAADPAPVSPGIVGQGNQQASFQQPAEPGQRIAAAGNEAVSEAVIKGTTLATGGWTPVAKGAKVMPKAEAVVKMGDRSVDLSKTPVPWTVQNVSGEFLLVGYQEKGWVLRSDVVTLDEAPAYYTEIINHVNDAKKAALAYRDRAVVWHQKGDLDKEIADYTERLRLDPDSLTYNNRGIALTKKGEYDLAIADFNQTIRLDPGHVRAWDNRGIAWQGKKAYDRAIQNFNQAIQLGPMVASAHNNAAWLLATCPDQRFRDGRRAVELATKACDLTAWTNANNCGTLAAAYAEVGDFEAAAKYQLKAIELNPNQPAFVEGATQRLSLYEQHKPYRSQ
jgi:tetratricopeptide (TPR) repeat protein